MWATCGIRTEGDPASRPANKLKRQTRQPFRPLAQNLKIPHPQPHEIGAGKYTPAKEWLGVDDTKSVLKADFPTLGMFESA